MLTFIKTIKLPEEISFKEHTYICFKMSAIMSGIELNEIDKVYNAQIHTMVPGVVHPKGEWTVKTVIENQEYAIFICHVSNDGLISIPLLNYSTSFRIDRTNNKFYAVRFLAVPCNQEVGFDGLLNTGSFAVFRHDIIHSGFLARHFQKDPIDFF